MKAIEKRRTLVKERRALLRAFIAEKLADGVADYDEIADAWNVGKPDEAQVNGGQVRYHARKLQNEALLAAADGFSALLADSIERLTDIAEASVLRLLEKGEGGKYSLRDPDGLTPEDLAGLVVELEEGDDGVKLRIKQEPRTKVQALKARLQYTRGSRVTIAGDHDEILRRLAAAGCKEGLAMIAEGEDPTEVWSKLAVLPGEADLTGGKK